MKRRLLPLLILALGGLGARPMTAASSRPNLLIILADDQGWNDVGWHNPAVKSPNLDRLCQEGVKLEQSYVTPMCSPTRATLLSGRYASRFGVSEAQNERAYPFDTMTLPRALKEVGYRTALIGKWHLGSAPEWGPQHFGFDYSYGTLAGGCGPYSHNYKAGPYAHPWVRNGVPLTEEGHVTDLIAADTVRYLQHLDGKPFFLYVPFTATHVPVDEPEEYLKMNPGYRIPAKQEFYADVSHLDAAVGRIMAALRASGQEENTFVLFLSDNGATPKELNERWLRTDDPRDKVVHGPAGGSNLPLRGQKTEVYEGGIRTPAFVRWPGKLKAGTFNGVIHAADWMPTLCALAGYEPAHDLKWDGRNVWPWLTGAAAPEPRQLYWVNPLFKFSAVRDGDWKLVVEHAGDRAQLFNLAADPDEKHDLAGAQPDRVANLRQLMARLAARDNDSKVREQVAAIFPDDDNYPLPGYNPSSLAAILPVH